MDMLIDQFHFPNHVDTWYKTICNPYKNVFWLVNLVSVATRFFLQVIGSGQFKSQTCAEVGVNDDSGLGNDNDWQIRPVMVITNGSKVNCLTRPIFPVVKIKLFEKTDD